MAPLGGTRAVPGPAFEPRIAADFSGVNASTSLSLCDDPETFKTVNLTLTKSLHPLQTNHNKGHQLVLQ